MFCIALVLLIHFIPEVEAGWLDPLKNKAKDGIDAIAFIGFCYSVGKLYAKDFVSGIFGLAASIALFNAENILSGLK